MTLGATTWTVDQDIRAAAQLVSARFGGTWNSYRGHGVPPARGERRTIDHWGPGGRGDPLPEAWGDAMCAWILGQHQVKPVAVLIWWSWWWRPKIGWVRYSGYQGNHGPGPDAHIHVGYE